METSGIVMATDYDMYMRINARILYIYMVVSFKYLNRIILASKTTPE